MTDTNPTVKALLAEADAYEALAAAKRAQAAALTIRQVDDPLLDVEQVMAEFGVGRDSLRAAEGRGELTLHRGARGKLLIARSAVRRWIESRPVAPRPRKAAPTPDLAAWEREQEQELRVLGGGRRK